MRAERSKNGHDSRSALRVSSTTSGRVGYRRRLPGNNLGPINLQLFSGHDSSAPLSRTELPGDTADALYDTQPLEWRDETPA